MSKNKTAHPAQPARTAFRPAVYLPLIFGGMAGLFFTIGLWLLVSTAPEREFQRGSALQLTTAGTLRWRQAGETVLVEGRLAPENRQGFRDFIAYHRDRYDGKEQDGPSKGIERWTSIERATPPLIIDTADGKIEVVNARYTLRNLPHRWYSGALKIELFGVRPERVLGFVAGDPVVVEGRVTESAPGGDGKSARALEASVLAGGNHATYLADLKGGIVASKIVGGVFVGVGLLLGLVAWIIRTRLSRAR